MLTQNAYADSSYSIPSHRQDGGRFNDVLSAKPLDETRASRKARFSSVTAIRQMMTVPLCVRSCASTALALLLAWPSGLAPAAARRPSPRTDLALAARHHALLFLRSEFFLARPRERGCERRAYVGLAILSPWRTLASAEDVAGRRCSPFSAFRRVVAARST